MVIDELHDSEGGRKGVIYNKKCPLSKDQGRVGISGGGYRSRWPEPAAHSARAVFRPRIWSIGHRTFLSPALTAHPSMIEGACRCRYGLNLADVPRPSSSNLRNA